VGFLERLRFHRDQGVEKVKADRSYLVHGETAEGPWAGASF
jgi:hypothetical protein